ncbi:MAG: DUF3990 domain-containing protein [Lachnospiraceae bacterium]|nr:DUF3990 domain-containing protein [Lachnospiraceae bacterium]
MIVYHGTTMKVESPDVTFSKRYLDFGKGFYVTTFQQQAEKWALRKSLRQKRPAVVNLYEMSEDLTKYRVLSFEKENEKWLEYVCACRKGENIYQEYDIVIGSVADDDVFKTVDMYLRGLWDKERTLTELRYYKMNDQICIVNQEVLNQVLIFKKAYYVELKSNE